MTVTGPELDGLSDDVLPWDDPALRRPATPVVDVTAEVINTARHMTDVLRRLGIRQALGVAANQLGSPLSMFTYFADRDETVATVLNPKISDGAGEKLYLEGCLSIPGMFWWIDRPKQVLLRGQNINGNDVEVEADNALARLFQHELDHLEGRLILDRLPRGVQKQAQRKLAEARRLQPKERDR